MNNFGKFKLKKMTVISQTFGLGGAESFLTDLYVELQHQGIELEIFTNYQRWQKMLRQCQLAVKPVPFDLDIIGDWKGLVKAFFYLPAAIYFYYRVIRQAQDSDCLLLTGFGDKILVTLIAAVLNKPVIWIEFGPLATVFAKFFTLPKQLYLLTKVWPKLVLTSSEHSRKLLIQDAQIKPAAIVTIPCGRQVPVLDQQLRRHSDPMIVCISRLEPGKGQDLLMQAMALVHQHQPNAKLKIIGEGAWLSDLQKIRDQLGARSYIEITGRINNIWSQLKQADIVVCPSMWALEGFGMVVIEAMAMAKPVVGFDRGPTNEIVVPGQTGLLAKPGNVDDLAQQILILINQPELRRFYGRNGQIKFNSYYTIAKVAAQFQVAINRSLKND